MQIAQLTRRPAVRWALVAAAGVLLIHLAALVTLLVLQRGHSDVVLTNVHVAGHDTGGLDRGALEATIEDIGADRLAETLRLASGDEQVVVTREEVGVRPAVDATADRAWERGRRGLWRALGDHFAARRGPIDLDLRVEVDEDAFAARTEEAADQLTVEARSAAVELHATGDEARVEVVEARSGQRSEVDAVRTAVAWNLGRAGSSTVAVPYEELAPDATDEDAAAVRPVAEKAISAPITLRNPVVGEDLAFAPADLASVLAVELVADAPPGQRLELASSGDRVDDHLDANGREAVEPPPVPYGIDLEDGEAVVREGQPGFEVDEDETARRLVTLATQDEPRDAELPGSAIEPEIVRADVEALLEEAAIAVSAPISLANPARGDDLVLQPVDLSEVLTVEVTPDAETGVAFEATEERLLDHLGSEVDALQTPAVDASFDVVDGVVQIADGADGFAVDAAAAAARIAELASEEEPREGELPGTVTEPDLTRTDAEGLGIEEEVSSFTTSLVPGQPRNNNIRRGADHVDGTLILPGERVSLNETIGRRTRERGFGENGFIRDGDLVSVVGGGVSQLGTTFMNAAWFAGIRLIEFQPHSFYFSHYPMGREATLSWNTVDVVIENDSPYGILVTSSHSERHVTFTFYSTPWAEVDTWTGDPYNRVSGQVRNGFTVDFGRTITYPDGSTRDESYTHVYRPEN